VYGIIVYSIVFFSQQAIEYGAIRGAEAAVRVDPTQPLGTYQGQVTSRASSKVVDVIGFIGVTNEMVTVTASNNPAGGRIVSVRVDFSFGTWGLPTTGFFPVPDNLQGSAVVRSS